MMRVNSIKFTPACESSSNATRSRATSAASSSRHCEVNIQQKGNNTQKNIIPARNPKQSGGSKKIVHFNVDGDGSADDDVDDDGDVDDDDDDGDGNADDDDERRW